MKVPLGMGVYEAGPNQGQRHCVCVCVLLGPPTPFPVLLACPVFLSFFGIASIGLSCLVALFLYHVVFGIQYLGILNGVAAFVIVGIGELILLPW